MRLIFKNYIHPCKVEEMERFTNEVPANDCCSDYIGDFIEKTGYDDEFGLLGFPARSVIDEWTISKDA